MTTNTATSTDETTTTTTTTPLLNKETSKSSNSSNDGNNELDLLLSLPTTTKSALDMKIAIVGGGVAGLLTARVLKGRGFTNLTLYEAASKVGGVWAHGYPNFAIQTPGSLYEFPDMPMKPPKDYKDGKAIQQYCEDYVKQHDLASIIHLNTRVNAIEKDVDDDDDDDNTGSWKLTIVKNNNSGLDDGKPESLVFDFVILASGLYSEEHKFVPMIDGLEENFKGDVYHSQDTSGIDAAERKGKQVVVVGFGKSAQDVVMNAYQETGVPPILLFIESHWCVPRKVLGLIPMEWLIYSRFGQGTLPRWQECGPIESVFQNVGLIWLYWRIVEVLFSAQLGLYGSKMSHVRPTLAIEHDMYCGHGVICHPDIFPMMRNGKIKPILGQIAKVTPGGKLLLKDGKTELEADEIVFATGFRRQLDFLPQQLKERHDADGFYAYRHMFIPGVRNICFLNSNVTTFSNITTPGIQAAWLSELLRGNIHPTAIKEDVEADQKWRRSHLTHAEGESRSIFIQLHQIRYWDLLLRDMGINVKRKNPVGIAGEPILSALANFFVPLASADYKDVVTGDYKTQKQQIYRKNYKPSWWLEWSVLGLLIGSWTIGYKAFTATVTTGGSSAFKEV